MALTRGQLNVVVTASALAAALVIGGAFYALRPTPKSAVGSPGYAIALPSPGTPTVDPTTASPTASPTHSASPSRTPSRKPTVKPKPKPSLSPKPTTGPTPPPVPPASPPGSPSPGASCPYLTGPTAPLPDVNTALLASAGTAYWGNGITLRPELMQAVAWEESGWQSTIMACDGGTGTMQVMPATATWMNEQCDTNFNLKTLTGNVAIGAEYLEWLVRYFGNRYWNGDYSLKGDPDKLVLLDVVIAAYQQGFGVIDKALANNTDLPNWWYIGAVESLMTSRPWVQAMG